VHAAGYANFLGMAGRHRTFHTPSDNLAARRVTGSFSGALRYAIAG